MTVNRKKTLREGLLFSAITLCLSYLVFWGPIAVFKVPAISFVSNVRGPIWAIVLFLLGGFVPSVVGIVLTRIREGTDGLKSLLKRCLQFRLGLNWYLAIVIVVLLGSAGQLIIHSLLGNVTVKRTPPLHKATWTKCPGWLPSAKNATGGQLRIMDDQNRLPPSKSSSMALSIFQGRSKL
jgi:hypothetical protein